MQTIQASEAKTKFLSILDEVERGESVLITRHGKPIARIVPEAEIDRERVERAIEGSMPSGSESESSRSRRFSPRAMRAAPDGVCS